MELVSESQELAADGGVWKPRNLGISGDPKKAPTFPTCDLLRTASIIEE